MQHRCARFVARATLWLMAKYRIVLANLIGHNESSRALQQEL